MALCAGDMRMQFQISLRRFAGQTQWRADFDTVRLFDIRERMICLPKQLPAKQAFSPPSPSRSSSLVLCQSYDAASEQGGRRGDGSRLVLICRMPRRLCYLPLPISDGDERHETLGTEDPRCEVSRLPNA